MGITLLIVTVGATTEIMENLARGGDSDWRAAWAKELSSGLVVVLLIPLVAQFLERLNLNFSNLSRAWWLVPGFVVFSLVHIAAFTAIRALLWASAGETYQIGSIGWSLLFEMRKDLLVFGAIMLLILGYEFVLNRMQGEARFLRSEAGNRLRGDESAGKDPGGNGYREQFLVKMLNREYLVRLDEIDWVGSASNYVLLHCGQRSYPMRSTLTGLAGELDRRRFLRVHRTAIVNLERVKSLHEGDELKVELDTGVRVPVSRTHLPELKQALAGAG